MNLDLESFYRKADNFIQIAASYTDIPNFKEIVISCRLKPITIFTKRFRPNRLERWWVDEFGNSIHLENNGVKIIKDDRNIKCNTQISTDLFYGRSIIGNLKISKGISLVEDNVVFYGEDNYFRCFNVLTGKKISPLEININELIDILKNYNSKYKLPNTELETIIKKEFIKYE